MGQFNLPSSGGGEQHNQPYGIGLGSADAIAAAAGTAQPASEELFTDAQPQHDETETEELFGMLPSVCGHPAKERFYLHVFSPLIVDLVFVLQLGRHTAYDEMAVRSNHVSPSAYPSPCLVLLPKLWCVCLLPMLLQAGCYVCACVPLHCAAAVTLDITQTWIFVLYDNKVVQK